LHTMMVCSTEGSIAGIVLAAGESRRMGTNKLLLMLAGEELVRRACRRGLAAGLDPLIVVLGHESERVRGALAGLDCRLTCNSEVRAPMSVSLHTGLKCLPSETDAVIVMLADMVHVTEHMVRALTVAASTSAAPVVVSRYGTTLAPPVLFRRALFPELLAATGEGCGKTVIERHRTSAHFVDWPLAALGDVDTPEEFAKL
jgi:molybdenum cofactor cytidylyltransferase